ncbi:hypothetical protein FDECE_16940 [Fusarium decemcellulare]|nr:hypothetical protein FDECE_16940 [Fusarium decemcellulare]
MTERTGMPMSHGATSRPTETLASPAVVPLTYRLNAPLTSPGANRSLSVPSSACKPRKRRHPLIYLANVLQQLIDLVAPPPFFLRPPVDSFTTDAPQFTFPTSWDLSSTTSTPSPGLSNPSPTDPKQPSSYSVKKSRQGLCGSIDYNAGPGSSREGGADDESAQLGTFYSNPKDYPAYQELKRMIDESHNEHDRWKACETFHQKYKKLKEPVVELEDEIEKQRRKLEDKELILDEKESSLDALVLLGTSFMLSKCDHFGKIQRSYDSKHKRQRNSNYAKESDVRATTEDWSDFLDDYGKASREQKQREAALQNIGAKWGDDKIEYYGWATNTWTVCRKVKVAATAVPDWIEARIKLNRLRNYRDRRSGNPIADGKRSISWKDLEYLSKWKGTGSFEMPHRNKNGGDDRILPYKLLATSEFNSERLGFDKFGVLIVKETTSDVEQMTTFVASPWGMAESPGADRGFEKQIEDHEPLLHDEDWDPKIDSQDKPHATIPTRVSARLATRQPISYSNQMRPIEKPSYHGARKRPDTEKHVGGDETDSLALAGDWNSPQTNGRLVDAFTQTDPMLLESLVLVDARASKESLQGTRFPKIGGTVPVTSQATQSGPNTWVVRPVRFRADLEYNDEFKKRTLDELMEVGEDESWGAESSRSCRDYLLRSSCPTIDQRNGLVDAHFSTIEEAKQLVEKTTPKVPIFTRCRNAGSWKAHLRPIVDYLTQAEGAQMTKLDVQKYCLPTNEPSYVPVTQLDLICHFVRDDQGCDGLDLWNALDLKNYVRHQHVPEFLTNSNCGLLGDLRQHAKKTRGAKRVDKLLGKDPQHFALIADGGMNTYPHSDSHGYSTFLTVQEGELIFGWLSGPDDDTWDQWAQNPRYCKYGEWRYVVMKPGDSVYLPSGMPHYVVRKKGSQTFILGGHVLQWSNLQGWASLLRKQMANPVATNEHMALETVKTTSKGN